jgi:NitT/TauT family transport system substrate-binding protein
MKNIAISGSRHLSKIWKQWLLVTVLATVGLAVFPGCNQSDRQVRLALNPWPGYAFLFLAEEQGFFEDENVDVRLVECMSLADVRRTFELQQADVMACTLVEALLAGEQSSQTPQVVLVADFSKGGDVLIARREIKTLADLRDCRIALEPASLDVVNVFMALQRAELQFDDVNIVPVSQTEMPARFERRDVDVVQCYPPVSSALLARDDTHVLFNSTLIPDAIADILAADADFVTEHPDKLAAILRAYARARKFYLKHPGAAVEIMARRTGMTATEFEAGLAGVSLVHPDESADSAGDLEARLQNSLSITARALIKMGLITGRDLTDDLLAPMELSELAAR